MNIKQKLEFNEAEFDANTDIEERRKKGQFFTPTEMAEEIVNYGISLIDGNIRFLEPAFGMGTFYYALKKASNNRVLEAIGIEQDPSIYKSAKELWGSSNIELVHKDFTELSSVKKVNLLITNPPYVRHQLLDKKQKEKMKEAVKRETGITISGLSGLYCYFLLLADKWLDEGSISGWLVPSELMDVNYGKEIKEYLLNHVRLLRIHRYNPENSKFDDALVSSCVVWFKKEQCSEDYEVEFTYGGTHLNPELSKKLTKSILLNEPKWTRFPEKSVRTASNCKCLNDYFDIKRGLATGDNDFFIMTKEQISENKLDMSFFVPVLPSPRKMKEDEVFADKNGFPSINPQLFLLKCDLLENEIEKRYPRLWKYLQTGIDTTSKKFLCKNRKHWYWQEKRTPTSFVCSYMGRSSEKSNTPFRFILNHSNAIVTNSYLMLYPKKEIEEQIKKDPSLTDKIWKCLQTITTCDFENEGRIYGGGLRKMEPKELGNLPCRELEQLLG